MELLQLKYFIKVAELQSISRAAERLHISQPALSQTIIHLEKDLGVSLFDRIGKRIYLNEHGKIFLAGARKAIGELDETTSILATLSGDRAGRASLGMFANTSLAADAIRAFSAAYPEVGLDITCSVRDIDLVSAQPFDVMIFPDAREYRRFKSVEIARRRLCVLHAACHPLAGREKLDITDLRGVPLVFLNSDPQLLEMSYAVCRDAGFEPDVLFETDSRISQREIIASGAAAGFDLLLCPANGNYELPGLCLRDAGLKDTEQAVMLGCRRNSSLTDSGKKLRDFMLGYFGFTVNQEVLDRFEKSHART